MEIAESEFGLGAPPLPGEDAAAPGRIVRLGGFVTRNGKRSCTSLAPKSPRRAARHTAPIGNLGMRTQATRHSNCTADLHGSMSSSATPTLFDDDRHASFA